MKSLATRRQSSPRTQRSDGWTADRRRAFIESVAAGRTVEAACACVGMSKASVYALRLRDRAFALGWSGATLRARDALADSLLTRAMDGQVETWILPDGSEGSRRRYDNRLALALLARLDRLARQHPNPHRIEQPDEEAARGIAHDLGSFLDLIAEEEVDSATVDRFVDTQIGQVRQLSSEGRLRDIEGPKEEDAADAPELRTVIIRRIVHVDREARPLPDQPKPESTEPAGKPGRRTRAPRPASIADSPGETPIAEATPTAQPRVPVMPLVRYEARRSANWVV